MLPNEMTGSAPVAAHVAHPYRNRSDSESRQMMELAMNADRRRQSISEGSRASIIGGGDNPQTRPRSGSRGNVLADLFRFRPKSTNPQEVATKPGPQPEANLVGYGEKRPRSNSTVDRSQFFLMDPAINRPQVSPATVESSRARMIRQRKDLAPMWVTTPTAAGYETPPSSSVPVHVDTNLLTVPQTIPSPPRKEEAKKSVFDTNWGQTGQTPAYKNKGRRLSLLPTTSSPFNNADPEFGSSAASADTSRTRSGSKQFADFFRIRRKSNANSPPQLITPSDPNDSGPKSPLKSPQKLTRRQRSKSTVEPPVLPSELRPQWKETEPIAVRMFNAKRDLRSSAVSGPSFLQTETQVTPMSELLSRQTTASPAGPSKPAFGIMDFLQLYNSQNISDSRRDGRRSPSRGSIDIQLGLPTVDDVTSDRQEDDANSLSSGVSSSRIISGQALSMELPESIPEYMEVHQVSSSASLQPTRCRKISPIHQTQDPESGRELTERQNRSRRRYSEPSKPNLRQMAVLNSIHMKLVSGQDNGSDDNNNKAFTSPAAIAQTLGIKIPMTSRHELLLWRNNETGAQLLKLPVNGEDHLDDLYDINSKDELTFVKLMKLHKCHELMPQSAKLILLDSSLEVISAFFALMFNGIKSAPIWESSKRDFVGMLTVTDFINILQMHYNSPEKVGALEEHQISRWMDLLHGPRLSMITVDPDDRLFDAVVQLSTYQIHRVLVADSVNGDALYVLTYKRILQFIYLLTYEVHLPGYMEQSIEDLQIGTYGNKLCTVNPKSRVIDALNLLTKRRISAVPVVNDNGQPINIYAKVDVMNLAANEAYKNLDKTIEETLTLQRERFEGVFLCKKTDTLHQVMKWLIQENIHRLLVVDDDMLLVGIVSLSDIVRFLVIRQNEESGGDVQPGDVDAEIDIISF